VNRGHVEAAVEAAGDHESIITQPQPPIMSHPSEFRAEVFGQQV
jgi:hypothetical protein